MSITFFNTMAGGAVSPDLPWCIGKVVDTSLEAGKALVMSLTFTDGDSTMVRNGTELVAPIDGFYILQFPPIQGSNTQGIFDQWIIDTTTAGVDKHVQAHYAATARMVNVGLSVVVKAKAGNTYIYKIRSSAAQGTIQPSSDSIPLDFKFICLKS